MRVIKIEHIKNYEIVLSASSDGSIRYAALNVDFVLTFFAFLLPNQHQSSNPLELIALVMRKHGHIAKLRKNSALRFGRNI